MFGVKQETVYFNETTLIANHSYSINVYVVQFFNPSTHQIGTSLALIKTIPVITFSQLNIVEGIWLLEWMILLRS